MKTKYKRALSILLLLVTTIMLSSATKSPYYAKTVVLTRVFQHKLGYKVFYMANDMTNREAYLPMELFQPREDVTRSSISEGNGTAYPYMTIFWKNGEFSHIKLYIKKDHNDVSWGAFVNPDTHDENFKNAELKFDF